MACLGKPATRPTAGHRQSTTASLGTLPSRSRPHSRQSNPEQHQSRPRIPAPTSLEEELVVGRASCRRRRCCQHRKVDSVSVSLRALRGSEHTQRARPHGSSFDPIEGQEVFSMRQRKKQRVSIGSALRDTATKGHRYAGRARTT